MAASNSVAPRVATPQRRCGLFHQPDITRVSRQTSRPERTLFEGEAGCPEESKKLIGPWRNPGARSRYPSIVIYCVMFCIVMDKNTAAANAADWGSTTVEAYHHCQAAFCCAAASF